LDYPEPAHGKHLTAREGIYGIGRTRLPNDHYGSAFKWNVGDEHGPELEPGGGVIKRTGVNGDVNEKSLKRPAPALNGDGPVNGVDKRVKVAAT